MKKGEQRCQGRYQEKQNIQKSTDNYFACDLQLHGRAVDLLACDLLLTALAVKSSSEEMVTFTKKNLK